MKGLTGYTATLANSIIGVGILSMPYCFQKCGIFLSILLLILSNIQTRLCCAYLLRTSVKCRRKNFEFLASYVFGASGKLMVELCTIGYLLGTCIAFHVVVGDIGPLIVSKLLQIENSDTLRTFVMILTTIVCILPLGLLKNIESLSHISTTSIIFYFCLVIKIIAESEEKLTTAHSLDNIYWWRTSGVLQCLPIFSMALSCQMQLFEVFESLPVPSAEKMNDIVKNALNICTIVYILVGVFGYVAFCDHLEGNILLSFSSTLMSAVIKLGFVFSVAFSFPLVIFPCRASLSSLLYHRSYSDASHYIPEHRFQYITIFIVFSTMIVGILTPSIEFVIGLNGSTIGVGICIIFPASCFIKTNKKNSLEKLLAQFLLIFGIVLMVLGTVANFGALDEMQSHVDPKSFNAIVDAPADEHFQRVQPIEQQFGSIEKDIQKIVPEKVENYQEEEKKQSRERKLWSKEKKMNRLNGGKLRPLNDSASVKEIKIELPKETQINVNKIDKIADDKNDDETKIENKIREEKPAEVERAKEEKIVETGLPGTMTDSAINKEAIQREEQEIAIENKEKEKNLEAAKEIIAEMKDVLQKQNEETQKLIVDKIDKISEKMQLIEKLQVEEKRRDLEDKEKVAQDEKKPSANEETNDKVQSSNTNQTKAEKVKIETPKNEEISKQLDQSEVSRQKKTIDPVINSILPTKNVSVEIQPDKSVDNIGRDLLSKQENPESITNGKDVAKNQTLHSEAI